MKITDRMKDIIITAGGKNVAPSEIENALKASPYIKEAIVIGDRRPYLTALIGIELDTVGHWAQTRKLPYTTYRDLGEKKEVRRACPVHRGRSERAVRDGSSRSRSSPC